MKAIHLLIFPFVAFIVTGIVYANWQNWVTACGSTFPCSGTFQVFSLSPALALLIQGNISGVFNLISSSDLSFWSSVISLAIGAILILLSFGLGFGGGAFSITFSFTPNTQGTKLAQVLGFTLVIWAMAYFAWGGWLTTLPYGISGSVIALFQAITLIGAIWQSQSIV